MSTSDSAIPAAEPAREAQSQRLRPEPARVIEVGAITAGIAVPEEHGVRFFSSCRDFDGLDGIVFRNAEQAARAARERARVQSAKRGRAA